MRAEEIRELSDSDLLARIAELERERFNLRFKSGTQTLEDPLRLRVIRKDVARLKTVQRERQIAAGGQGDAAGVAAGRTKGTAKRGTRRASRR
jgi:large subunit ribosomal protein L29